MLLIVHSRARTAAALAALTVAALIAGAPAAAASHAPSATASHAPSAKQIRAAVRSAEHSRLLWATVNICNTKHHAHTIGIRGQAPSLSFATTMSMKIQVDYWNGSKFVADPHASKRVPLGDPVNRIVQGGANFSFHPPAILSGTIRFEWHLAGEVIGHVTRRTGHGYKHVAGGDPPGYSAATCRMT